jgi:protein-S-isoprenylcysteine O-methyltransferase Ste14
MIPVLVISLALLLLIAGIMVRAIINKQTLIGRPPVPVFFFVLAKMLVIVNLVFLLLKGLDIPVNGIFAPGEVVIVIALALLILGTVVLFLSAFALKNDLIFGLPSSGINKLQTTGIFAVSRHPFYLGFLFILFSSCLFTPHYLNIAAFAGTWLIHHFIMIREEEFLAGQYGEEYAKYAKKVKRYITVM